MGRTVESDLSRSKNDGLTQIISREIKHLICYSCMNVTFIFTSRVKKLSFQVIREYIPYHAKHFCRMAVVESLFS